MTTQIKTAVNILIDDQSPRRYVFHWNGFSTLIWQSIKTAGAKYEKPNAGKGLSYCYEPQLSGCVAALQSLDIDINPNFDLDAELERIRTTTPEPYSVIKITDRNTYIHFPYDKNLVVLIKAVVPASERDYDDYTHDWIIRHTSLSKLITGLRTMGIPTKRLEDIEKVVRELI